MNVFIPRMMLGKQSKKQRLPGKRRNQYNDPMTQPLVAAIFLDFTYLLLIHRSVNYPLTA